MSIYILDTDPKKCAEYYADTHISVGITAIGQVLGACHWILTDEEDKVKLRVWYADRLITREVGEHVKGLFLDWVKTNKQNYIWLSILGMNLVNEHEKRSGKKHLYGKLILNLYKNIPTIVTSARMTQFPQKIPKRYRHKNPVTAYRRYYVYEKAHLATWKNGKIPEWFKEGVDYVQRKNKTGN